MKESLVGRRFGRLVVVSLEDATHSGRRWRCRCDCGGTSVSYGQSLKSGRTKSCGCYGTECMNSRRVTHGDSGSAEHRVLEAMRQRCTNPKNTNYKNYGAKGIAVCARWLGPRGYANFLEDMGRRPSVSHSIERKDGRLGYFKENCVWATRTEQNNNTSRNHFLNFAGKTLTVAQWAREKGVSASVFRKRLQLGWSLERVLTTPVDARYVRP